jgi:hypothetical protein
MHRYPKARWFAACLFAIAAMAPLSSWWLLLFHVTPPHLSAADAALAQLGSTFSPTNPERWWFIVWALLPIFFIATALFYCSRFARNRSWSVAAAAAVFAVTMYCLAFAPSLGFFLIVPFGFSAWWAHGA